MNSTGGERDLSCLFELSKRPLPPFNPQKALDWESFQSKSGEDDSAYQSHQAVRRTDGGDNDARKTYPMRQRDVEHQEFNAAKDTAAGPSTEVLSREEILQQHKNGKRLGAPVRKSATLSVIGTGT